jgi:hypothetical protein
LRICANPMAKSDRSCEKFSRPFGCRVGRRPGAGARTRGPGGAHAPGARRKYESASFKRFSFRMRCAMHVGAVRATCHGVPSAEFAAGLATPSRGRAM